jgi:hypothetical protein
MDMFRFRSTLKCCNPGNEATSSYLGLKAPLCALRRSRPRRTASASRPRRQAARVSCRLRAKELVTAPRCPDRRCIKHGAGAGGVHAQVRRPSGGPGVAAAARPQQPSPCCRTSASSPHSAGPSEAVTAHHYPRHYDGTLSLFHRITRDGSAGCNNIRPMSSHDTAHGVPANSVIVQMSAMPQDAATKPVSRRTPRSLALLHPALNSPPFAARLRAPALRCELSPPAPGCLCALRRQRRARLRVGGSPRALGATARRATRRRPPSTRCWRCAAAAAEPRGCRCAHSPLPLSHSPAHMGTKRKKPFSGPLRLNGPLRPRPRPRPRPQVQHGVQHSMVLEAMAALFGTPLQGACVMWLRLPAVETRAPRPESPAAAADAGRRLVGVRCACLTSLPGAARCGSPADMDRACLAHLLAAPAARAAGGCDGGLVSPAEALWAGAAARVTCPAWLHIARRRRRWRRQLRAARRRAARAGGGGGAGLRAEGEEACGWLAALLKRRPDGDEGAGTAGRAGRGGGGTGDAGDALAAQPGAGQGDVARAGPAGGEPEWAALWEAERAAWEEQGRSGAGGEAQRGGAEEVGDADEDEEGEDDGDGEEPHFTGPCADVPLVTGPLVSRAGPSKVLRRKA